MGTSSLVLSYTLSLRGKRAGMNHGFTANAGVKKWAKTRLTRLQRHELIPVEPIEIESDVDETLDMGDYLPTYYKGVIVAWTLAMPIDFESGIETDSSTESEPTPGPTPVFVKAAYAAGRNKFRYYRRLDRIQSAIRMNAEMRSVARGELDNIFNPEIRNAIERGLGHA